MLAGLSNAPQYVMRTKGSSANGSVVAGDVDSVILPANACGGDAAIVFARSASKNKVNSKEICLNGSFIPLQLQNNTIWTFT